ncbi:MAG: type II secretion system F family protein [Bacillota bacterium]
MIAIAKLFHYQVRNRSGNKLEGTIEAESKAVAIRRLKEQDYFITAIEEQDNSGRSLLNLDRFKKVKLEDLTLFCRQFATMIDSGLTLIKALSILSEQVSNVKLKQALENVRESIEEHGLSLSKAFQEEDVFPQFFISMVEAGETGGILDEVLLEMADHFEKENELKQKITSALAYPLVITLVAVGLVVFLITVILPTFVDIFAGLSIELPLPTRILLGLSDIVANYWYLLVGGFVGIILVLYKYYQTSSGKNQIDHFLLKLPLVSDLIIKVSVARFSRTLGILLASGVSILESLEVVSRVVSNQVVIRQIREARESVSTGESMARPLQKSDIFPAMVVQMIRVGEETGNLDQMLVRLANFYDQEVEHKVEAMVSLIEPALILVLGVVVGGIVIAMMLPMFDMMQGF